MTEAARNRSRLKNLRKARRALKLKWAAMTPEERTAAAKRRFTPKRTKAKANSKRKETTNERKAQAEHISYLYGKVETIIEYYARSNGVPFSTLAEGVASLLRH